MQASSGVLVLCALCAAAAAAAAATARRYCRWRLAYWRRRGVAQLPRAHWLFGHYRAGVLLRAPPAWLLGQLYRASAPAPVVGFYIFHKPCLLLRDPDVIKRIFVTDFDNFADRNFAGAEEKDSFGMVNLFGLRGDAWRYLRRRLGPALAAPRMRAMLPLMLAAARPMLRHAAGAARRGAALDAQELSHLFAADLIASVALGTPTDSFAKPDAYTSAALDFFSGIRRMLSLMVVFFVPWLPPLASRLRVSLYYDFSAARALFWRAWRARAKAGADARGDFLDTLLTLNKGPQNPLYEFTGNNLLYTAGTFFSGFESSATVAAFALLELARRPALAARARAGVRRAVAARGWAAAALADMPLLAKVLRESLRMHPPLPMLDRIAKEDYQIPGTDIVIEKGVAVYVSVNGLQTDPKYFPEPDEFDPERFAAGRAAPDAYLPFGRGPRMCASVRGGELHATLLLAAVLHHFELSVPAPADPAAPAASAPADPAAPAPAAPAAPRLDPHSTFTLADGGGMPILFQELDTSLEPNNII